MKVATITTTALSLALGALFAGPANAAIERHTLSASPADRCQGALPSFEGALRKRPLGVQNEGAATAFVTCAFAVEGLQEEAGSYSLSTWYYNANQVATNLTCTAVSGFQTGTNEYVSQTVTIAAGQQGQLFWDDADFASGLGDGLIAISCGLPVGVAVNDTYISWDEDDSEDPPNP